jgi:hypothetical protein
VYDHEAIRFAFLPQKARGYTSGDRPICMRITVDGTVTELSIQRSGDPACWDAKSYRAVGKREPVLALNAYLDTLQAKVYEAKLQLIQAGHPVTAENIKNLVLDQEIASEERPRMIMEIFAYHNQQMAALVGKEFAPGTLERYETSLKTIDSFVAPLPGSPSFAGAGEGNPCFSAGKLKRLQVIGFEGVFLFELFSTIYSSLN